MLIEAARRAEAAASEMLELVGAGAASCSELREMLAVSRSAMAALSAAQVSAAAAVAGRERHGDGGAGSAGSRGWWEFRVEEYREMREDGGCGGWMMLLYVSSQAAGVWVLSQFR